MPRIQTVRDLEAAGIPGPVVQKLVNSLNGSHGTSLLDCDLLALQAAALNDQDVLEGTQNLIVAGPTSAGKTLVAQAMIARTLARDPSAKVLYLVPLRALVTEKYGDFVSVFAPELQVVPVSSDYPLSDDIIARGRWSIAVVVFDKVYHWLSQPDRLLALLTTVDLVVIDELQVMELQERGEKLELILSYLLWYQRTNGPVNGPKLRLVAMAASHLLASMTQSWLQAQVTPKQLVKRPVPLYEGWISLKGESRIFEDAASKTLLAPAAYPESLTKALQACRTPSKSSYQAVLKLATRFLHEKMRVLVYVASQNDARSLASYLAAKLRQAQPALDIHPGVALELLDLDDSPVKDALGATLRGRVGFHHGNMTRSERAVVEHGFLHAGDELPVGIVVATSTLSMGVNMPTDVLLLHDHHTHTKKETLDQFNDEMVMQRTTTRPLSVIEYRNLAGRAGRFRPGDNTNRFGVSLMVLDRQDGHDDLSEAELLLHGQEQPMRSQLLAPDLGYHPHVLKLLCAGQSGLPREMAAHVSLGQYVSEVFQGSYAASTSSEACAEVLDGVRRSLRDLERLHLLARTGLTGPGLVAAGHHLSLKSIETLINLALQLPVLWPRRRLEILYAVAGLDEMRSEYPSPRRFARDLATKRGDVLEGLRAYMAYNIPSDMIPGDVAFSVLREGTVQERAELADDDLVRVSRSLLAWEWTSGRTASRLNEYGAFAGVSLKALESLGERFAVYISALRGLWEQRIPPDDQWEYWESVRRQLWLFEQTMRHGVPLGVVALPILGGCSANDRLSRRKYMDMVGLAGTWINHQSILGQLAPEGLTNLAAWNHIRQALLWWQSRTDDPAKEQNVGIMVPALVDLFAGVIAEDFTGVDKPAPKPNAQQPPWMALAGISEETYRIIQTRTHEQLTRYRITEPGRLRTLLESTMARVPIRLQLKAATGGVTTDIRLCYIGRQPVVLGIIAGKPTTQALKAFPREFTNLLIVAPRPPDADFLAQHSRKIRMVITADAFIAGTELLQLHPQHLRRFLAVLSLHGVTIGSIEEIFQHMFSEEISRQVNTPA